VLVAVLSVVVLGVCGLRIAVEPIQVYGDGGAHFREHALRMELVNLVHSCDWPSAWDFFVTADQELHPPLLHVVSALLSGLVGPTAEAVVWTGLLWLLLLAGAVGCTAWAFLGRVEVAVVAGVACLLLPAAHASATRYYYDLPLSAMLWVAVAILALGCDRRPVLAGLASGLALLAATLIKWVALPFGLLMVVGVLCSRTPRSPEHPGSFAVARVLAGLALIATLMVTVSPYLDSGPSSLYAGSHTFGGQDAQGPLASVMEALPRPLRPLGISMTHELAGLNAAKLGWYPLALVARVLSPAWCLVLLLPALAWFRGSRTALPLLAWTVVGHLVFLVATMSLRDARFVLPLAPALVLLSVLGWAQLSRVLARRVALAGAVVGFLVAVDFHHGPDAPWNAEFTVLGDRAEVPPVHFRGLGLADSFEQRGWSRASAQGPQATDERETVWAAIASCGAPSVGTHGEVFDQGGALWLRYRAALAEGRDEGWTGGILVMTPTGARLDEGWRPHPDNGWSRALAARRGLEDSLRRAPSLPPGGGGLSLEERRHVLAARLAPLCQDLAPSRIAGLVTPDERLGPPDVVLSASLPAAPAGWLEVQRVPRGVGRSPVVLLARSIDACPGPSSVPRAPIRSSP